MKHFENIWEKSEQVSELFVQKNGMQVSGTIADIMSRLHLLDNELSSNEERYQQMGSILFMLTYLSKKWDINTWSALQDAIDQFSVDVLDPDLDSEF